MAKWRDIRAAARLKVHQTFAVSAYYVQSGVGGAPVLLSLRVHDKYIDQGDPSSGGLDGAVILNQAPTIKVKNADLTANSIHPKRGDYFSVAAGEVYRIEQTAPEDQGYTEFICKQLSVAQLAAIVPPLPVPA